MSPAGYARQFERTVARGRLDPVPPVRAGANADSVLVRAAVGKLTAAGEDYAPALARLNKASHNLFSRPPEELTERQLDSLIVSLTTLGHVDPFDDVPPSATDAEASMSKNGNLKLAEMTDEELEACVLKPTIAVGKLTHGPTRRERMGLGAPPYCLHDIVRKGDAASCSKCGRTGRMLDGMVEWLDDKPLGERDSSPRPAPVPALAPGVVTKPTEQMLRIDLIGPSPYQPRRLFDPAKLRELAASLVADGQFQNVMVRPHPTLKGTYELLDGERRLRAAQEAKIAELRCSVYAGISEAKAIEMVGLANYEREQFNAIEEAQWFKQMLGGAGYTQDTLAKRLKISQPLISQRLALLDLPEVWRQRVITGVMPATYARELTPWAKQESVLKQLEKDLKNRPLESLTAQDFANEVGEAVERVSRPLSGRFGFYDNNRYRNGEVLFKPAADQLAQLAPFDHRWGRGSKGHEKRTFNVALWEQLQAEAEKKAHDRQQKQLDKAGGKEAPRVLSAAEKRDRARQQREQDEKRLKQDLLIWYRDAVRAKLPKLTAEQIAWCFTVVACSNRCGQPEKFKQAIEAGKGRLVNEPKVGNHYRHNNYSIPGSLLTAADNLAWVQRSLVDQWTRDGVDDWQTTGELITTAAVAAAIGIDVAREWRPDDYFLKRRTREQLVELAGEWKVKIAAKDLEQRGVIVGILRGASSGKALALPKCLRSIAASISLGDATKPGAKKGGK